MLRLYQLLLAAYGPQEWWPAESRDEMLIGAILTQNTAWSNVERGIAALRTAGRLTLNKLAEMPVNELAELIRPTGYYRQKARRLQTFARLVTEEYGDSDRLAALPTARLRAWLLAVPGIGPETADSMLCYGFSRPVFVVDAYTMRIFGRRGLTAANARYHEIQALVHRELAPSTAICNEYHALLVRLAKECCRAKNPLCGRCPVAMGCRHGDPAATAA
jgi:endonuclease-3 related protein